MMVWITKSPMNIIICLNDLQWMDTTDKIYGFTHKSGPGMVITPYEILI